jgi:hypothetical protein
VDDERRRRLRGAVDSGDGPEVVELVRNLASLDAAQLIGDGLLAALAQHVEGAAEQAQRCADRLRERGWEGDEELAEQLGVIGRGASPMLRALPVDLEEIAAVLDGNPGEGSGRIDLESGEVWPAVAIEYAQEMGEEDEDESEDPERWLPVHPEGSGEGYRDMEDFIATVRDPGQADRLAIAINGRGAFRRFKDVLTRWPDERERWFVFSNERQRGRARAWLARAGYRVAPPRART